MTAWQILVMSLGYFSLAGIVLVAIWIAAIEIQERRRSRQARLDFLRDRLNRALDRMEEGRQ